MGATVHRGTISVSILKSSCVHVSIISVSRVHVSTIISHDKTSPVHGVLPPRYNTEISPVERRKIARIIIIKTFNNFFFAVIENTIINK